MAPSKAQPQATPAAGQPAMSLAAVTALVQASAADICGTELAEDAHFASHQFDSLSAVELATSIGKAVGLNLSSMDPLSS